MVRQLIPTSLEPRLEMYSSPITTLTLNSHVNCICRTGHAMPSDTTLQNEASPNPKAGSIFQFLDLRLSRHLFSPRACQSWLPRNGVRAVRLFTASATARGCLEDKRSSTRHLRKSHECLANPPLISRQDSTAGHLRTFSSNRLDNSQDSVMRSTTKIQTVETSLL